MTSYSHAPVATESDTANMEMRLLCACLQHSGRDDKVHQIETFLVDTLDWPSFIQLASAHSTLPLLYKELSQDFSDKFPSAILKQLETSFQINTLRNQYLTQELFRLLSVFAENNISAISFKGPSLAVQGYGELSLRAFSDLDILVRRQDFSEARKVLLAAGYNSVQPLYGIADAEAQELALMESWGECAFQHVNGQFLVDLHGRLIAGEFPLLSADFEPFWDRTAPVRLLDQDILAFCAEDLLLYLCIHGCKDLWKKLGWVCDIANLIQNQSDLDWACVIVRSQQFECEQMLWIGMSLAIELLSISIPEVARDRMQLVFKRQSLVNKIQAQILSGTYPQDVQYSQIQRIAFHSQLVENRADRMRFYLQSAKNFILRHFRPNINDKAFISLPKELYSLYYVVRPVRLLTEGVQKVLKLGHRT